VADYAGINMSDWDRQKFKRSQGEDGILEENSMKE
jgi:hypothetical protein